MKRIVLIIIGAGLIFSSFGQKNKNWSPNDIVCQETINFAKFSNDGQKIIWYKTIPDKNIDWYIRDLYIKDFDQNKELKLTNNKEKIHQFFQYFGGTSCVISSDNQYLLYTLDEEGKTKLYKQWLTGGGSELIHTFDVPITSKIKWFGTEELVFTAQEGNRLYEIRKNESNDDIKYVEDKQEFRANRVFSFNLKTKLQNRITDNNFPISNFALSPNGQWLITSQILSPTYTADGEPEPQIHLWDLRNKKRNKVSLNISSRSHSFKFTDDNAGFYFVSEISSDIGYGIYKAYYYNIKTAQVITLAEEWENGIAGGLLTDGENAIISLSYGAKDSIILLQKDGLKWTSKPFLSAKINNKHIRVFDMINNKLVYSIATASSPTQMFVSEYKIIKKGIKIENSKKLTTLNKSYESKEKAKTEIIYWTGANGDRVDGLLYYPINYIKGKQYPLVVSIHGGPSGVNRNDWHDTWQYTPHIYADKGAFVLMPNYHGSSNHGLPFLESIKGNYYDQEMEDIEKGIDFLNKKGLINKEKMVSMGWSNGALITIMLTVKKPDLFKAAVSGSGTVNWVSGYSTCRFGVTFGKSYIGGSPWDDMNGKTYNDAYILKGPIFEMDKVKTPTLIIMGSDDDNVPRDQAWEHYRALQQIGQADVRFLWIPNERHVLNKISHRLRKVEEEVAWIDKYIFNTIADTNLTIKKNSPISCHIAKSKLKIGGSKYFGGITQGIILPQVKEFQELGVKIGITEVTNQQFKMFAKHYNFEAGKENYPSQVSFTEALEYVKWLNIITKQKYRLPNINEAELMNNLALKNYRSENNLNYWAGYEITYDEIEMFKLESDLIHQDLIKEVASFKPIKVGDFNFYDLGGNVAEYYNNKGKQGVYGFSAFDFADKYNQKLGTTKAVCGFRIVKE